MSIRLQHIYYVEGFTSKTGKCPYSAGTQAYKFWYLGFNKIPIAMNNLV